MLFTEQSQIVNGIKTLPISVNPPYFDALGDADLSVKPLKDLKVLAKFGDIAQQTIFLQRKYCEIVQQLVI